MRAPPLKRLLAWAGWHVGGILLKVPFGVDELAGDELAVRVLVWAHTCRVTAASCACLPPSIFRLL